MLDLSARKVYGALAEQCVGGDAKADKVENATSGHLAGLDSNGNLTDSGVSPTEDVTVEGNPITFESPFEQDAKSVVVSVKPIQDLHGYDHPWPAGGGKNKMPMTVADIKAANPNATWNGNTTTIEGVTFEILTDSGGNVTGIYVHGTAIATATLSLYGGETRHTLDYYGLEVGETYTLTGGANNVPVMWNGSESNIEVTTNSADFTVDATSIYYPCIRVYSTSVDAVVYPMVRLSSVVDATFAPYSNECPISGIDEVEIEVSDGESEPTTTTIPLPSTLYDADVDVTEGSADSQLGYIEVDDTEDSWTVSVSKTGRYITNVSDGLKALGSIVKSSHYAIGNANEDNVIYDDISSSMLRLGFNTSFATLQEWLAYITAQKNAGTPVSVAYTLATPTTISFDPTDVELLEGTNVVSTNGEKVAVTYGRSLWQDIDDLKTDTEGKLDKSDVATIEGDTASKAYSVNDFMLRSDGFYKVTQPIAQNASITSSNTTKTTIGAVLTALLNS